MRGRVERVFAFLEDLIGALPVPPSHRELLRVHLDVGRERAEIYPELPAIQLPLLVHAAISGDESPALPVAGACTLLYLGADLFDNVIDDELPPSWRARDPAEASLAAATLLAAIPQLAFARLRERRTSRLWELTHLFAEALLTMSAGEHEELIEKCAAFGLCLGTASQICSDVGDIWGEEISRDLLNGRRTLPVVHALYTLRGESRERLQELLEAARESGEYHDEVRSLLAAAGSIPYTALIVEVYRQRARSDLAAASPREPAGRALKTLLDGASLLLRRRGHKLLD